VVTGAAGFIGSTLVDRLLGSGHEVLGVDDLSTGRLANHHRALEDSRFRLVEADVGASVAGHEIEAARPEVVFHLAAQMDVRHSVADPVEDARRNVLGTVAVLEAAHRSGSRKVVFASSGGSIYGDAERLPADESTPVDPHSPYAASKVAGEVYLGVYRRLYGLHTTALALGNVFGPRQDPRGEAGVVAIFASALLEGRPAYIYGDGSTTRDYIYVDDVVDAFVGAAGPDGDGMRLNIGSGVETSVQHLYDHVGRATGSTEPAELLPERPGELSRVVLDCAAAGRVMGWRARTSLEAGLARTVAWLAESAVPVSEGSR
jgi:UDP-glucose 4-epimerase